MNPASQSIRPPPRTATWLERRAKSAILSRLGALRAGRIRLSDGSDVHALGAPADLPSVEIAVHDPAFYRRVLFGGCVAAAESYMDGHFSCSNLTALMRIFSRDLGVADGMERGLARLSTLIRRIGHRLRRNTIGGARRNIMAHYDLGNDFFSLWLDPTLAYSCAIFEQDDRDLEQASLAKFERICGRLDLQEGDRVLEVGCGWGGFAMYAASRYRCHVTTITISPKQHAYVKHAAAERGLDRLVDVRLQDYRSVEGVFDKAVSIEMIEAVGAERYGEYFRVIDRLLENDGAFLLQAITIADHRYERARRDVDFIQRYIFPGSCIPSVSALASAAARHSTLRIAGLEDITPHYAQTLRIWRERFLARRSEILQLGFDEPFLRMWEWYLSYCEGGFAERRIGDVQMLMVKPGCRKLPPGPPAGTRSAASGPIRMAERRGKGERV